MRQKPELLTIEWPSKVRLKTEDWEYYKKTGIKCYHMAKQEKLVLEMQYEFIGWGFCKKRRKPFFVYKKGIENEVEN